MSAKKKAALKNDPAVAALKAHDAVWQMHLVLGIEQAGPQKIRLRCVEPEVSGATVAEMFVPVEFGRKLCPGMVLKTTLSIVGMYSRSK